MRVWIEGETMNSQYTVGDMLSRFIGGIKMLAVPRLEDLPYSTSPPIQFVWEVTANLALGIYTFNGIPVASPAGFVRPLRSNVLYYFRNLTLIANVDEEDFLDSLTVTPAFQVYKQSENGIQLFREPIRMNAYFRQFDYRLVWLTNNDGDTLNASFAGTILQTPGLIGKASITLKAIIAAQEILDDRFIKMFRDKSYPQEVESL